MLVTRWLFAGRCEVVRNSHVRSKALRAALGVNNNQQNKYRDDGLHRKT